MSFTNALGPYIDEDGLVLERPNESSGPETGNGIHGSSLAEIFRVILGQSSVAQVEAFSRVIRSCEVYPTDLPPEVTERTRDLFSIRGLYHRGPRKTQELEAHDDYIALCAASSMTGAVFAKDICRYGEKNFWSFNNLEPGKWTLRTFFARHPGFYQFVRICAGQSPGPLGDAILAMSLVFNAFSRSEGGKILAWMKVQALSGRLSLTDLAIDFWRWKLLRDHPDGMREVFKKYYGPAHPFAVWAPRI